MLSLESLNATKDLVAILADKGVSLRVKGTGPMVEAMAATKVWHGSISCLTEIDKLPGGLYQANEPRMEGGELVEDAHCAYQEAASKALGVQLAGHVAHATTVVLPAISDLYGAIKAAQDTEAMCGVRSYNVQVVTGSPLLDITEIGNQIDEYAGITPSRELPFVLDFKPLSDEELMALMKVGAQAYDDAVELFAQQAGMPAIREVYDVVFSGENKQFENYDVFRSDQSKAEVRNFTTFLIASKLMMNTDALPEVTGNAGMSSAKYPLALRALLEVSGPALYSKLSQKRTEDKQGKLINRVDGKIIYVNKSVYDRFMTDGGDVETILGAVVSGQAAAYAPDLVENVDKLKGAWQYHLAQAKTTAATHELINVRYAINNFVRQYVQTSEDEVVAANRTLILDQLASYLECVYKPALADVQTLATKVVCECIYNHTDAMAILMGVNEAMRVNPDISKEDALNLAVTDYVAGWYASQIDIDQ